ncbi:MAG: AIPR family protein [Thaumarchaeota archaeon]|nr:AIPR family protein [Nitrososphaerota archaeon]
MGESFFKVDVMTGKLLWVFQAGIQRTLDAEKANFWYYNNGITVLCDQANLIPKSKYIRITNPQVINGCQTVWSIANYEGELKSDVLVRVMEGTDHEFIGRITRFQNSSNRVVARDFKSTDPIQVRLKREFKRRGYYYEIKRGEGFEDMEEDEPSIEEEYPNEEINNEDVAKVLAAIRLSPEKAVAGGPETFFDDEAYDDIFPLDISTGDCLAPYLLYWDFIKESYRRSKRRFHSFDKQYVFKNPASTHVLKFMYDALRREMPIDWERKFIAFCEVGNDGDYDKFWKNLSRIIGDYFEICHASWLNRWKKEGVDYNAFFQGPKSRSIQKEYPTKLKRLEKATVKLFKGLG